MLSSLSPSSMTTNWLSELRQTLHNWDDIVAQRRTYPWCWSDAEYLRDPGLRYGAVSAEFNTTLHVRQRRGSTGELGRGRRPPSAMYIDEASRPLSTMKMRLPVHVWAMLVRGLEAESEQVEQVVGNGHEVAGVGLIQRWREYDGEPIWPWRAPPYCDHFPEESGEEYVVQQMQWKKKDGRWCGEWAWEEYKRSFDWKLWYYMGEAPPLPLSLLPDYPTLTSDAIDTGAGGTMPQEILLEVIRELKESDWETIAAVGLTCRAWLKVCAPQLYSRVRIRATDIDDFISYLSRPRSHITQFAQALRIRGDIPWLALPRLFKHLRHVQAVVIEETPEEGRLWGLPQLYNPRDPHFGAVLQHTTRYSANVKAIEISNEYFSSLLDLLHLLGSFPYLSTVVLGHCTIESRTRLATTPVVSSTQLAWIRAEPELLLSLVHVWEWPHPPDSVVGPYPGLNHTDACGVTALLQNMPFDGDILTLDKSWHADSWVITACSTTRGYKPSSRAIEVEFHLVRRSSTAHAIHGSQTKSAKAHVHHLVFRLHAKPGESLFRDLFDGKDSMARMDPMIVTSFPHLASVTLETTGDVQDPTFIQLASQLTLVRAQGMLEMRTCGDAERIAQEALRGERDQSAYTRDIVSPLWYADWKDDLREMWHDLVQQYESRPSDSKDRLSEGTSRDAPSSIGQSEGNGDHDVHFLPEA